ncbi:hypothetical protein JXQ70_18695 [bacterium]|nr:hypothetical protein [bacterium]
MTNVMNCDERSLQRYFIEILSNAPELIILGSSRIMSIDSGYFPGRTVINNGVSGASIEDVLAIYSLYRIKGYKLKTVLVGTDPWLFNDNYKNIRWQILQQYYFSFLKELNLMHYQEDQHVQSLAFKRFRQLFAFNYFRNSYKSLGKDQQYYPTQNECNEQFTRKHDGSICYDLKMRSRTRDEVMASAHEYISKDANISFNQFSNLSHNRRHIFEGFVEYLQKTGSTVSFILMPYHPVVYELFQSNEDFRMVAETERYLKRYAAQCKIPIMGSFNPATLGLGSDAFYDGMHCNQIGIAAVLGHDCASSADMQ